VAVATLSAVTELRFVNRGDRAWAERVVADLELHHGQAMFGFVRRQGLSDTEAQDAVQEALLRLFRELRSGRSVDSPRAWAFRALYRLAMDEHRERRRLRLIAGRVATQPRRSEMPAGDRVAVWAAVDELPERQRQVLYLRYRADLSFDDIARVMGIGTSSARSHATQAMARLRARLSREDFE
jgi:RNA polymerase sigma factor (sigma-70 family)